MPRDRSTYAGVDAFLLRSPVYRPIGRRWCLALGITLAFALALTLILAVVLSLPRLLHPLRLASLHRYSLMS